MLANTVDNGPLDNDYASEAHCWQNMHSILISATRAITQTLSTVTKSIQSNPLSPFIRLFDSQLLDLQSQNMTSLGKNH